MITMTMTMTMASMFTVTMPRIKKGWARFSDTTRNFLTDDKDNDDGKSQHQYCFLMNLNLAQT